MGLNGSCWEPGTGSAGQVMNDIPTSVYDVHSIRKAGWPTGGDAYGHGVLIVVRAWESHVQGEAGQVSKSL